MVVHPDEGATSDSGGEGDSFGWRSAVGCEGEGAQAAANRGIATASATPYGLANLTPVRRSRGDIGSGISPFRSYWLLCGA